MPKLRSFLPMKSEHGPELSQQSVSSTEAPPRSLLEKASCEVVEAKLTQQALWGEVEPARQEEARSRRELQEAEAAVTQVISSAEVQAARVRLTGAQEKHEIARQCVTNLYQAVEAARVHTRTQEERVDALRRQKVWLEKTAIPKAQAAIYHQEYAVAEAERKLAQQRATFDERQRAWVTILEEYKQLTGHHPMNSE